MGYVPFVFELIVVFCVSLALLHQYGRISKQHPIVTIATLIAWYFSLLIVFVLPLDVASTFYRQCLIHQEEVTSTTGIPLGTYNFTSAVTTVEALNLTTTSEQNTSLKNVIEIENETSSTSSNNKESCRKPPAYVPNVLPVLWHIVYWTSQILTWIILPFMQSYSCAGDFSVLGKIKRALIENAIYYVSYLIIFCGLLIYVAASPDLTLNMPRLKVILITAANTWGLFLLVLLLGYGLVEVPRAEWQAADFRLTLKQSYFTLAKLSTEKQETTEKLTDLFEDLHQVANAVHNHDSKRKYVDIIISKCPEKHRDRLSSRMHGAVERAINDVPTEKYLVNLQSKVIQTVHIDNRNNVQWDMVMKRALRLENLVHNAQAMNRKWVGEYPDKGYCKACFKCVCTPSLYWYWFCIIKPNLRKAFAVCLAVLSLMVIWSECTFFSEKPVLSLFAIFINAAAASKNYFWIEMASCLIILYLSLCAYYTVFRIKFFNYYYIAGNHQTDESSLLFVGIMLCRLAPPLCLNFLGMILLDTPREDQIETYYTQIMGHLVVISFISDGFNVYFPIFVCVLCIATYFSLGQRCLTAMGFQRFVDTTDDLVNDLVDEGRQLVNREKRRMQREENAVQRAERQNELRLDADISERQWRGRTMKNAESQGASGSSIRFSKRRSDKVELLDDVMATDYSSVTDANHLDDDTETWENPSQRGLHPGIQPRPSTSSRPPKNLFDDV